MVRKKTSTKTVRNSKSLKILTEETKRTDKNPKAKKSTKMTRKVLNELKIRVSKMKNLKLNSKRKLESEDEYSDCYETDIPMRKTSKARKWKTLEHEGPVFPPPYEKVPKNVKFYYNGKHIPLSKAAEEAAGFYAKMLDHEYTSKNAFNYNFFKDWRNVMSSKERDVIQELSKCDFTELADYYKRQSEERKRMDKEEKQAIKKENEKLTEKYGYCIIDGHREKLNNFRIEPPGIFRARGMHPKMGMLKKRIEAEDVSINIGKAVKVPKPPSGHKWKEVLHDNTVLWMAKWTDNILGSNKYILLNPSSKQNCAKEWQKYETARELKAHVDGIRAEYRHHFDSKDMRERQRAVALYFIDELALRAGNEKDEDTADTVGCCSLRVEHITLHDELDGCKNVVSFDFPGKDSIRYKNSVSVDRKVFRNLKLFVMNKLPDDDLFDHLNTTILNRYLHIHMRGLTAKVFRTYNASKTFEEKLHEATEESMSLREKISAYNRANRVVAVLCNHQKAVGRGFTKSMATLADKVLAKAKQVAECKKSLRQADKKNGFGREKNQLEKMRLRLEQLEGQLERLEEKANEKEENKDIALGTSKLNYLDPRISVAWCKKFNVPVEKIYSKTQRDKFNWAIETTGPNFKF